MFEEKITLPKKNLNYLFVLLFLVLISVILYFSLYSCQVELLHAQEKRYQSYILAAQLRKSSDELTRLVRTYAATNNSKFEKQFWEVLKIRDGELPRPEYYNRIYWDFLAVSDGLPPFPKGEAMSLKNLMKNAGITKEEFDLLEKSKNNSDRLVNLEKIAMNAMKGLSQDKNGKFTISTKPDKMKAIEILHGEKYHKAKVGIMEPLNTFFAKLDQRTQDLVTNAAHRFQIILFFLISVFFLIVGTITMLIITSKRHYKSVVGILNSEVLQRTEELENELQAREQVEEQRKILLDDLVRANSDLKDFSYTVSHDLKAPLRGISSIANWLSEDYSESLDKKGQEYLDKLLLRTKRMHELIQGILQYSRVGRKEAELQQLDSKIIFQEIVDSTTLPENFTITIKEPLPILKYDKTLFIQVFQNLIENAVKHLDKPSGEVVVSCIDQGGSLEFCVKDNGVGIEEKHHERIFKIFQSLKPHTVDGSTGIGLTLVKKIIENNGGKVRLESLVNKGSSFFVTMPKELKSEKTSNGSSVLIIDNNIDFIKIVTTMLQFSGYKVLNARTGLKAFEILDSNLDTISIVLFDLHILGVDLMKQFKTYKKKKPDMKTIVYSGNTTENNDLITQVKVDGILEKPFTINDLNSILIDKLEK